MASASGGAGAPPAATNPLLNPNAQLSGNALYQAAVNLANAQTQAPLTELARQIAQQQAQTQNALKLTGGYFNQLGQYGQQAVTDQNQIASGLNSTLAGISGNENQQLQGIAQNGAAQMAKYSPGIGTGGPGMQSLTTELARQQGLAVQNEGAYQRFGATQGANFAGLSAAQLGVGAMRGQEMLGDIGRAGQLAAEPLQNKVAALEAQKGALISTDLGKLRQQEINNQIARTGLGIKTALAQNTISNSQFNNNPNKQGSSAWGRVQTANNAAARNQNQASQNAFNDNPLKVGSPAWARVQSANGRAWSQNINAVGSPAWARAVKGKAAGDPSGAKPLSTYENNAWFGKLGRLEQLIQNGQQAGQSEQNIRSFLQSGQNPAKTSFDPFMVQVAYELLGYGSINQSTAAIMHNQYGLRGGTFRGKPIRVTANYNPNNPSQNPTMANAGNAAGNAIASVAGG